MSVDKIGPEAFGAFEALFAFGLIGASPFASGGVASFWFCRLARAFFFVAESVLCGLSASWYPDAGLSVDSGDPPPVF